MRKNKIIAFAALLLFAACSNEEKTDKTIDVNSLNETEKVHAKLPDVDISRITNMYVAYIDKQRVENCDDPADKWLTKGQKLEALALDKIPMTDEEEIEIGETIHQDMRSYYRIIDNDPRWKKLDRIVKKMNPFIERKGMNFRIHLVDNDTLINAFAIAGGHLYITTALLNDVQSEDELAGIIGHEMTHVDKKHCQNMIKKLMLMDKTFKDKNSLGANIAMLITLPFGQIQEYESDRGGAYLAYKVGFDPSRFMDFFKRLKEDEGDYTFTGKIQRTHPYSAQRESCLEKYIAESGKFPNKK